MRFGVNYTPSHNWFYSWHDVDWDSTARDMASIANLGLDHVRIFPLWPVLQPNRSFINPKAVADVRRVAEIAADNGLEVYVDVLQGHLSSYDFVPSWLTSWHQGNMFTDPAAIKAQAELVGTVHNALDNLPAYRGITLGNEVNQFSGDPHPTPMRATSAQVDNWLESLLAAVPSQVGKNKVTFEYDAVWYLDNHPFLLRHASQIGDITAIHSWIFNGTAQQYGALSPQSLRHAEYLIELSRAFAVDPERQVWLQEIGAPGNVLADNQVVPFAEAAVRYAADSPALWGVTWWCSHDVGPNFADFPPFEHTLGLLTNDGKPKPLGYAFRDLALELRETAAAPVRTTGIVIPVDAENTPISRAALGPGGSIFEEWVRRAESGERPTLITSLTAQNDHDKAARGVTRIIPVELSAGSAYSSVSDPALDPAA